MIDLNTLYNRNIDKLDITNEYEIPSNIITDTRIKSLDKVQVKGYIKLEPTDEVEDDLYLKCTISGTMHIEDSISLEDIPYEYNIEYDDFIDEKYKNNENRLDIFEFLWENIELEVPIKLTNVEDYSKYQGKDWQLISEEDIDL